MSSSESEASDNESESDTENAVMDMRLLQAFRSKPLSRRRKIGEIEASDEEDEQSSESSSDDDDDEEEVNDDDDEGDADDAEIEEFVGKKGTQLFRCRFCPEKGPFKSLEEIKVFMAGKFYLKTIKKVLKSDKIAKRDAAVARQVTDPKDKERVEAKRQIKHDKLKLKIRAKKEKQISNLSESQIEKRKQRFQLKKQRREDKNQSAKVNSEK